MALHRAGDGHRWRGLAGPVLGAALLVGCKVGPDYVRPPAVAALPTKYKGAEGWKVAQPGDELSRGAWWKLFEEPALDSLEQQVNLSNQNLAAAEAQYREARAAVGVARAQLFPTVTASLGVLRAHNVGPSGGNLPGAGTGTNFSLPVDFSWEVDVWGRIRRAIEAAEGSAGASAADLESARLSAQAQLAQDYFLLRALDAQAKLLEAAVANFGQALELTRHQYAAGVASRADILQAETQLESTRAQQIDVGVQRAQVEHAIAVLVGRPASTFSLPASPLAGSPPVIPLYVPSELLERRPDIAAAERRMASANAQIGVARAAYFPKFSLSASGGFVGSSVVNWLTWSNAFWSVGPSASGTIFEGGLRRAQEEQAQAAYDYAVASYRQTALGAFQDVEDNLAALRILEEEARVQDVAVANAREAVRITMNQYREGTASFLQVLVAQTTALTAERTAVDILGRRMTAAVLLIKALGGGWKAPG